MKLPDKPRIGTKLVFYCINCDSKGVRELCGKKTNAKNRDGSTCFTVTFLCNDCGYMNGEFKPIWYNFGELGCIHSAIYCHEETCELYTKKQAAE